MNSSAVAALTTMPMPATTMIVIPATGSGAFSRSTASQPSEPMATSSRTALTNAARILARFQP